MKRLVLTLVAPAVVATSASGFQMDVTPERPADLTGAGTILPWQAARHDTAAGTYTLFDSLVLPVGSALDALHRLESADWLLSVAFPADLGGTTYLPSDVVRYDPDTGTFSPFFCSAMMGLPPESNVDAVFLDGGDAGSLVVSFDAPTTISGVTYDPADLVAYAPVGDSCGLWIFTGIYFDASGATPPIPAGVDLVGADKKEGLTITTFDVATTLGGTTFLPGELVSWSGATLVGSYYLDPAWPAGTPMEGLALPTDPGRVPPTMKATRDAPDGSVLTLSWSPSCSEAKDYAIYEGDLGSFYSHTAIDCSDDGEPLTETVTAGTGNKYYLVVPLNPKGEGSYGADSSGSERPRGAPSVCAGAQVVTSCP